jgi:hypothetical protein
MHGDRNPPVAGSLLAGNPLSRIAECLVSDKSFIPSDASNRKGRQVRHAAGA